MTNDTLVITRTFDAPRSVVWKAWTDPEQIAKWWGPKGFTNPVCEWNAKPNNAIRVDMTWPDGVTVSPMGGMFHEVVEPERLVFSSTAFEDEEGNPQLEALNTITFAEENGKTVLTVTAVMKRATGPAAEAAKGQKEGWNQSLDKLADLLQA